MFSTSDTENHRTRLALVLQSDNLSGGAFGYELELERKITDLSERHSFSLEIYFPKSKHIAISNSGINGIERFAYKIGLREKFDIWVQCSLGARPIFQLLGIKTSKFESALLKRGVDGVYFGSPNPLAMAFREIPFITTVWDLGHRDLPEYPEMSSHGKWEDRELYFKSTAPKSVCVVTDSKATGQKLERLYGVQSSRWHAMGLLPKTEDIEGGVEKTRGEKFLLYPAHKWKHKNHETLFRALAILNNNGHPIRLVLTGVDKGAGSHLIELASGLGVEQLIEDRGFVSQAELEQLLMSCSALVMPSRLGPTNLPPLDALLRGKAVVVSDAHHFDNLGNAPIFTAEANSPKEWAEKILLALEVDRFNPAELASSLEKTANEVLEKVVKELLATASGLKGIH